MIELNNKVKLYNIDEKVKDSNKSVTLEFGNDSKNVKILKRFIKNSKDKVDTVIIKNGSPEIIDVFKAIYIDDYRKRLEFIYDNVCEKLDIKWDNCSPCKFCNNKCISSRNHYMDKEYDGCCYSFKRKLVGKVKKKRCPYLGKDKKCTTKNISCKLFTCSYLKEKTDFNTNFDDYLLLRVFFNRKEKLVIKYNFFRSREQVLDKLCEKTYMPYVLYLFTMGYYIPESE